jgi:acetyltransferase-like isoleucine patch superfamily enzyme
MRPVRAGLRRRGPQITAAGWRASRAVFLVRARAAATLADGHLVLDVHPTAEVSPHVRIEVEPGSRTSVVIGPRARVEEGTFLSLRGGSLTIGVGTQVRRRVTLIVGGRLALGDGVVLAAGATVHCADAVTIGSLTIIGGSSTITDSSHLRTPPGVPVHHSLATSPVVIGTNCWLGAGAVVASGVTVGDQSFVGAGAVVTRDVEAGWLVGGVPARPIHQLD